ALPVLVATRGYAHPGEFLVELHPRRTLPAGSQVGVAIGPTWSRWGGSQPETMDFQLEPRPRIEGIACDGAEGEWSQAPGAVIDFGAELELRASRALAEVAPASVQLRPALRDMHVEVRRGADLDGRNFTIRGEWEPDQVYELRFGDLRTVDGQQLVRTAPL